MPPAALSLPEPAAAKVRAGWPEVEISALPAPGPAADPGRPLVLLDRSGEVLGSGLADPENEVIRVFSRDAVASFDAAFFRRRVERALELRRALGLAARAGASEGTAAPLAAAQRSTAYRLLNAEGDGLPGFAADVYGDFVVLYAYSRGLLAPGRVLARALLDAAGPCGVVLKVRSRSGPRPGKVRQEVIGAEPPAKLVVEELGVPYEVHLLGGLNAGLFTDLREHRRALGRFVGGARVLNTFAYTGSLSVAAARAGAREVTSVDLSSGVLKWARENFRLAGLDPDDPRFRFVSSDVLRFVRAELEAGAVYDAVFLDPPTYSAARASAWSMKNDYPELIACAARLFDRERGGFLWVSSNTRRGRNVAEQIRGGMELAGREARVLETGGLPPDYPTPLAYPPARYLEVVYLRVE
jgi:23S rRNA (cytosine1962-C5)-methyltransferase